MCPLTRVPFWHRSFEPQPYSFRMQAVPRRPTPGQPPHRRGGHTSRRPRRSAPAALQRSKGLEPCTGSNPPRDEKYVAMGQNPNRGPSEHPNPTTKIGSKMGAEFTYPKMVPLVLTHSHIRKNLIQSSTTMHIKSWGFERWILACCLSNKFHPLDFPRAWEKHKQLQKDPKEDIVVVARGTLNKFCQIGCGANDLPSFRRLKLGFWPLTPTMRSAAPSRSPWPCPSQRVRLGAKVRGFYLACL